MLNRPPQFSQRKRLFWIFLTLWAGGAVFIISYLIKRYPNILNFQSERVHLVSLGLIFSYLSFILLTRRFRWSETIKYLTVWLAIALVLLGIYTYRYQLTDIMNKVGGEIFASKGREIGLGLMTFPLSNNGHFMIEAIVEGVPINFMLDTGATRVVLTQADAKRLGLMINELSYTQSTSTANGIVWSSPIRLQKIKIGSISISNIPASVSNSDLEQSLLGMSFLEKLKGYEVQKGILILKN